jgi:hypothetical protein
VRDIRTGEERRGELSADVKDQAGGVVWSPDGQAVLVVLAHKPCQPPEWTQAIVWVDLNRMESRTVVPADSRRFTVEG